MAARVDACYSIADSQTTNPHGQQRVDPNTGVVGHVHPARRLPANAAAVHESRVAAHGSLSGALFGSGNSGVDEWREVSRVALLELRELPVVARDHAHSEVPHRHSIRHSGVPVASA
jgi:hypothetical protein